MGKVIARLSSTSEILGGDVLASCKVPSCSCLCFVYIRLIIPLKPPSLALFVCGVNLQCLMH